MKIDPTKSLGARARFIRVAINTESSIYGNFFIISLGSLKPLIQNDCVRQYASNTGFSAATVAEYIKSYIYGESS